jgi:hypothetical protein
MAVRDSFSAVSDGDQLDDGYFNQHYYSRSRVAQVYTSTGFDATRTSATAGNTSNSVELTALTSTQIQGANYLILDVTAEVVSEIIRSSGASHTSTPSLQVETKEVGGSYADTYAKKNIITVRQTNFDGKIVTNEVKTLRIIHTLTAGEKSNGVQVRITGHADTSGTTSTTGTITNQYAALTVSD